MLDLHHVHIFASDASATIEWWQKNLGAVVSYDGDFGGSRPEVPPMARITTLAFGLKGCLTSETAWLPMASNFDPILENSVTGDI